MQNELAADIKLAVTLSILDHPAITPNIRERSETLLSQFSPQQVESARQMMARKSPEMWAQELLK
jgi:hypothetical protein